jgi:VWFA-related protein
MVGALALAAAVAGQEPVAPPPAEPAPAAPPSPYFEVLDVQVVNVEVFVTDRQGRPVTGLGREDFEIFEDGEPVAISNFYAVHDPGASAGEAEGVGEAAEPGEPPAGTEPAAVAPVPEEQRLNLVVFLDHMSLQAISRNQLLPTIERLLTELRPDDRVSIVVYDGAVKPLLEPTSDPQPIREALERASKLGTRGNQIVADRLQVLREIERAPMPGDFGPFAQDSSREEARAAHDGILLYGEQRLGEARRVTAALSQSAASLAGARGRKVLVYVGEGFSERPAEALLQAWYSKFGALAQQFGVIGGQLEAFTRNTTKLVEDVVEQANANLVTLYTVGPPGRGASAEEGQGDRSSSGARLWGPETAAVESFNRSAPLLRLAQETGGRAAVDGPNPATIFKWLDQDLRSYYSLGYVPPNSADGKAHAIEVKARDRGLRVRHRSGYIAKTADQRMRDRTLSALMLGADDNPLEVAIDFGKETIDEKGRWLVEFTVKFPMANVFLVPQERHHEGRLTIFVGSRSEDGGVSDIQKIVVPVRVPNDRLLTALGQTAGYRATLLMRPGKHQVAAGVRDELGNVEAAVRVSHVAGEPPPPSGG